MGKGKDAEAAPSAHCSGLPSSGPHQSWMSQYLRDAIGSVGWFVWIIVWNLSAAYRHKELSNLYNLALSIISGAIGVWYTRSENIDRLVHFYKSGTGSKWDYALGILSVAGKSFFFGVMGWSLTDIVEALALWLTRGGSLTPEIRAFMTYAMFVLIIGGLCMNIVPKVVSRLTVYPLWLLFGQPVEAPSARRPVGELVLAIAAGIGLWASLRKQEEILQALYPAFMAMYGVGNGPGGNVTLDVKHSDSPSAGVV
ncbi:hypothetical protein K461DRAFT_276604 [Myriangium duriaei CBS 260.36]|uniref:Uncharacterized protein n=1 Tax=Myriangium duriaei CBS 260.36 TaxID=1168546 RepID=A0A9P4J5V7_9PEZI|nr:hypothetical protein K461DRAFT_276604 [Myriangium duriaei CBS 260.36]